MNEYKVIRRRGNELILKEIGTYWEDTWCCLLGNYIDMEFKPGEIILANLDFRTHEKGDVIVEYCVIRKLIKTNKYEEIEEIEDET